jgi:serine/threonine-protein kinase HipA
MTDGVEVWLDVDFLEGPIEVGRLVHDRGAVRFHYDTAWLQHPLRFALDPDLMLGEGAYHPEAEQGNFRIFEDSAPDRWGQMLMRRREVLAAVDERRPPRTLYAWDFLLGVQDLTRQGALRFRRPGEAAHLSNEPLAAPPVTSLRALEAVAVAITARRLEDLDALRQWLAVLVAPGASLGGGRPKANFTDADGTLWIAKFPAREDDRDVGAWEALVHGLARDAGIDVPAAKLRSFGGPFRTFCVQRFDRVGPRRRFYASAMAMLRKQHSEGTSYLELAEFLRQRGAKHHVEPDLEQLFRRVAFNVAVGNRDDHLRNHGFILTDTGWRLAPAFDVNPNIEKQDHVLNIGEADNRPSLRAVIDSGEWYVGSRKRAARIVDETLGITRSWRQRALALKLARVDIEATAAAFEATDTWSSGAS